MREQDNNGGIFHIDVNSAFLSWTAVARLEAGETVDIREIPAIIGGDVENRHGVVLAKSIPAKRFGIVTGEPVTNALTKCPTLQMVPPDHALYRQKSRMLMEYLRTICPVLEQVSIDECYMDFTPIRNSYEGPVAAAEFIKDSVYERFGFTVNVGISDKKVLAKMASDFEKPNRVHTLYTAEIREKLWPLPVSELYMCGKQASKALRNLGISTIGDLAQMDCRLLEANMKSHGRRLWQFANGIDDARVETEKARAKSIGNSNTYSADLSTREEAHRQLAVLAEQVAKRLRRQKVLAGQVCVEIRYATFQDVSHQNILLQSTAVSRVLHQEACKLFDEVWTGGPVRLLGLRATKLQDEAEPTQLSIFDYAEEGEKNRKLKKLDRALDSIRERYGEDSIRKGTAMLPLPKQPDSHGSG